MSDLSPEQRAAAERRAAESAGLASLTVTLHELGVPSDMLNVVVETITNARTDRDAALASLRASEAERAPLLDALTACNTRNAALEAADAAQRTEIAAMRRQLDIAQGALNSTKKD